MSSTIGASNLASFAAADRFGFTRRRRYFGERFAVVKEEKAMQAMVRRSFDLSGDGSVRVTNGPVLVRVSLRYLGAEQHLKHVIWKRSSPKVLQLLSKAGGGNWRLVPSM
jgi:hypothetical protein